MAGTFLLTAALAAFLLLPLILVASLLK